MWELVLAQRNTAQLASKVLAYSFNLALDPRIHQLIQKKRHKDTHQLSVCIALNVEHHVTLKQKRKYTTKKQTKKRGPSNALNRNVTPTFQNLSFHIFHDVYHANVLLKNTF